MGSLAPVFDTNILIDYLKGLVPAQAEMSRYQVRKISVLTWIEIMAGTTPSEEQFMRAFLAGFDCVPLSMAIAERAALLRGTKRMKVPDAIILATAQVGGHLLVTRNTRDFDEQDPGVRVPYRI